MHNALVELPLDPSFPARPLLARAGPPLLAPQGTGSDWTERLMNGRTNIETKKDRTPC